MLLVGNQGGCPTNVVTSFCLATIFQSVRARFFGAMDATINLATSFNAVADYLAITVGTGG